MYYIFSIYLYIHHLSICSFVNSYFSILFQIYLFSNLSIYILFILSRKRISGELLIKNAWLDKIKRLTEGSKSLTGQIQGALLRCIFLASMTGKALQILSILLIIRHQLSVKYFPRYRLVIKVCLFKSDHVYITRCE